MNLESIGTVTIARRKALVNLTELTLELGDGKSERLVVTAPFDAVLAAVHSRADAIDTS